MTHNGNEIDVMEDFMKDQGQGRLALCECGKLHFTYGSVAVHFEREEFLSLFQTGAFWACGVCSYAITHSALTIDERRSKNSEGSLFGSPSCF